MHLTRLNDYIPPISPRATPTFDRENFNYIIRAIDGILGLEVAMAKKNVHKPHELPRVAQLSYNNMVRAVQNLIDDNCARNTSATRKADMENICSEIMQMAKDIIFGMHKAVAARPVKVN